LTSAAKTVKTPNSKKGASDILQRNDEFRNLRTLVFQRRNFQRCRIDNIGDQEDAYHFECIICSGTGSWFSKPSELHASHELGHVDLAAEKGAPDVWVPESKGEAIKEAIFPATSWGPDSWRDDIRWERSQKGFSFCYTSFRLKLKQNEERNKKRRLALSSNDGVAHKKNPFDVPLRT
jgi:hypothetical protein